jgi:hypothetical protein
MSQPKFLTACAHIHYLNYEKGKEYLLAIGEIIGDPPLRLHSLGKWYLCQMNSFHIPYELHSMIAMGRKGSGVAGATPMVHVLTGVSPVPP